MDERSISDGSDPEDENKPPKVRVDRYFERARQFQEEVNIMKAELMCEGWKETDGKLKGMKLKPRKRPALGPTSARTSPSQPTLDRDPVVKQDQEVKTAHSDKDVCEEEEHEKEKEMEDLKALLNFDDGLTDWERLRVLHKSGVQIWKPSWAHDNCIVLSKHIPMARNVLRVERPTYADANSNFTRAESRPRTHAAVDEGSKMCMDANSNFTDVDSEPLKKKPNVHWPTLQWRKRASSPDLSRLKDKESATPGTQTPSQTRFKLSTRYEWGGHDIRWQKVYSPWDRGPSAQSGTSLRYMQKIHPESVGSESELPHAHQDVQVFGVYPLCSNGEAVCGLAPHGAEMLMHDAQTMREGLNQADISSAQRILERMNRGDTIRAVQSGLKPEIHTTHPSTLGRDLTAHEKSSSRDAQKHGLFLPTSEHHPNLPSREHHPRVTTSERTQTGGYHDKCTQKQNTDELYSFGSSAMRFHESKFKPRLQMIHGPHRPRPGPPAGQVNVPVGRPCPYTSSRKVRRPQTYVATSDKACGPDAAGAFVAPSSSKCPTFGEFLLRLRQEGSHDSFGGMIREQGGEEESKTKGGGIKSATVILQDGEIPDDWEDPDDPNFGRKPKIKAGGKKQEKKQVDGDDGRKGKQEKTEEPAKRQGKDLTGQGKGGEGKDKTQGKEKKDIAKPQAKTGKSGQESASKLKGKESSKGERKDKGRIQDEGEKRKEKGTGEKQKEKGTGEKRKEKGTAEKQKKLQEGAKSKLHKDMANQPERKNSAARQLADEDRQTGQTTEKERQQGVAKYDPNMLDSMHVSTRFAEMAGGVCDSTGIRNILMERQSRLLRPDLCRKCGGKIPEELLKHLNQNRNFNAKPQNEAGHFVAEWSSWQAVSRANMPTLGGGISNIIFRLGKFHHNQNSNANTSLNTSPNAKDVKHKITRSRVHHDQNSKVDNDVISTARVPTIPPPQYQMTVGQLKEFNFLKYRDYAAQTDLVNALPKLMSIEEIKERLLKAMEDFVVRKERATNSRDRQSKLSVTFTRRQKEGFCKCMFDTQRVLTGACRTLGQAS